MADCRKVYNESKLKLTTAKGQLTKAIKKFEEACEVLMKETQDVNLTHSSKVRMAETLMLKLYALSGKVKDVKKRRNNWVNSIIEYEDAEFESVSKNKSKDDLLAESAADTEAYEDRAKDSMLKNDLAVRKAEALLAMVVAPQGQSGNTPEEAQ